MGTLIAPGVSVTVTDESLVSSSGTGTVPLFVFATAQDKYVPNSTTVAVGTKESNANKLYLLTSQKDVLQTYGNPVFQTSSGSVVQGDELNEYGLHALYSYMGIANRAYAIRTDLDLAQLTPTLDEPTGPVKSGTYWLNSDTSVIEAYVSTGTGIPEELHNTNLYDYWDKRTTHLIKYDMNRGYLHAIDDSEFFAEYDEDPSIKIGDIVVVYVPNESAFLVYTKTADEGLIRMATQGSVAIAPLAKPPVPTEVGSVWIRSGYTKVGTRYVGTFLDGYVYNSFSDKWISTPIYLGSNSYEAESYAKAHTGTIIGTLTDYMAGMIALAVGVVPVSPASTNSYLVDIMFNAIRGKLAGKPVLMFEYIGKTYALTIPLPVGGTLDSATIAQAINSDLTLTNDGIVASEKMPTTVTIRSYKGYAVKIYQKLDSNNTVDEVMFTGVEYINGYNIQAFVNSYPLCYVQGTEPTGKAVEGTYWYRFDPSYSFDVAIYTSVYNSNLNINVWKKAEVQVGEDVQSANPNSYWIQPIRQGVDGFKFYKLIDGYTPTLIDTTDQTTLNGIIFTNSPSDYSADLYSVGMTLCSLSETDGVVLQMTNGVWKVVSGLHADGSAVFGKAAQRKVIVDKLASTIVSNETIRSEYVDFNLLCAPGYVELLDELVTLNTDRRETAFIVTDVPATLVPTGTEIQAWATNANNATSNGDIGRTTRYAYAAQYAGWCYGTNVDGLEVAIPASTVAMRTYAYNDSISYVWYSPAGTNRGVVSNATSVGYITDESEFQSVLYSKGQLETLYSNSINPIELRVSRGLVVMGDKTLNADDTAALSRVNVARLVVYIRRQIEKLSESFLFKLNTATTRQEFAGALNAMLANIVQLEGLYDFQVVCDESNNTSSRIDANELWADIAIQPTKSINFIYVPIRIQKTS